MNEAIKYIISPATHSYSEHGHYETYLGVETRNGTPGLIHYKVCGRSKEESRARAEALYKILTTMQSLKK